MVRRAQIRQLTNTSIATDIPPVVKYKEPNGIEATFIGEKALPLAERYLARQNGKKPKQKTIKRTIWSFLNFKFKVNASEINAVKGEAKVI